MCSQSSYDFNSTVLGIIPNFFIFEGVIGQFWLPWQSYSFFVTLTIVCKDYWFEKSPKTNTPSYEKVFVNVLITTPVLVSFVCNLEKAP
jgi:hypothetical protein